MSASDFMSLSNLLDVFINEHDSIADKKTTKLRQWVQNEGNKILTAFHKVGKERLM